MKCKVLWCALVWLSLFLPATAEASMDIVDGKLWQEQVSIYDKPGGKVLYTVTEAHDPCREVRVSEGVHAKQGWLAVATFTPSGGILTGYVPALSVMAYTKDNTEVFDSNTMTTGIATLKKNYIVYFVEFTGGSSIKGTVSDGKKDWTGWMFYHQLTTTPE